MSRVLRIVLALRKPFRVFSVTLLSRRLMMNVPRLIISVVRLLVVLLVMIRVVKNSILFMVTVLLNRNRMIIRRRLVISIPVLVASGPMLCSKLILVLVSKRPLTVECIRWLRLVGTGRCLGWMVPLVVQ